MAEDWRARALAAEDAVLRVEALCAAAEAMSPWGVEYEKRHPDVTPSVLLPVSRVRAALDGEIRG